MNDVIDTFWLGVSHSDCLDRAIHCEALTLAHRLVDENREWDGVLVESYLVRAGMLNACAYCGCDDKIKYEQHSQYNGYIHRHQYTCACGVSGPAPRSETEARQRWNRLMQPTRRA